MTHIIKGPVSVGAVGAIAPTAFENCKLTMQYQPNFRHLGLNFIKTIKNVEEILLQYENHLCKALNYSTYYFHFSNPFIIESVLKN